ncbi:FAD linked oxidase [Nitzschia inconspicua]|uniref:FAD linked oxidase n=1 Tax=Nitzschia inconspicua TaxID=303405 RepID=A0A9K3KJ98_9STRA|nr:FAD linked oxidase [Nitzschia inconspicua]
MGSLFSKPPPPAVKPRDVERVLSASKHIDGPVREQLMALDKAIKGKVLFAPKDHPLGGTDDSDAYHQQRERPFYFNDCNYPSAIVLVETVDDIAATMRLMSSLARNDTFRAEEKKDETQQVRPTYPLGIAGGCHSSYCMFEKSIVIDMEKMVEVKVDTQAKTVSVQGGAKIYHVHEALKGTGFGFMTGTNTDTGVSGLTLVGGAGYLGGQAGFACDTVLEAEVVLPSGQVVMADDDNDYKDLLRGLRGGGSNFGIVTKWVFKLFDVTNAMAGMVVHFAPTKYRLKHVLQNYTRIIEEIPDAAGTLMALPPGEPVCINVLSMVGDEIKGVEKYTDVPFLSKVTHLGAWFRASNNLGRKDYITEVAPMLEPIQQRKYGSSVGVLVYTLDEALLDALVHFCRVDIPGKNSKPVILVLSITGEMRRNDGSKSSIRHRKAVAWIVIEASYEPHATEEQIKNVRDWADRVKAKVIEIGGEDGPHNFRDSDGRRIKFFTDEQRVFLEQTKRKYDPQNLLTLNKNIVTSTE